MDARYGRGQSVPDHRRRVHHRGARWRLARIEAAVIVMLVIAALISGAGVAIYYGERSE